MPDWVFILYMQHLQLALSHKSPSAHLAALSFQQCLLRTSAGLDCTALFLLNLPSKGKQYTAVCNA